MYTVFQRRSFYFVGNIFGETIKTLQIYLFPYTKFNRRKTHLVLLLVKDLINSRNLINISKYYSDEYPFFLFNIDKLV